MKTSRVLFFSIALSLAACSESVPTKMPENKSQAIKVNRLENSNRLFMDVHVLEPGGVTYEAVAEAHLKDLETQGKYNVSFKKFWVDEAGGKVYCLSEAPNAEAIHQTHAEAHGLLPDSIQEVMEGE